MSDTINVNIGGETVSVIVEGGNIGVGFAIPIEQVEVTTAQILRTGKALTWRKALRG